MERPDKIKELTDEEVSSGLRGILEGKKSANFLNPNRDKLSNEVIEKTHTLAFLYILNKLSDLKVSKGDSPYSDVGTLIGDRIAHAVLTYFNDKDKINDDRVKDIAERLAIICAVFMRKYNSGWDGIKEIYDGFGIDELKAYLVEHPYYSVLEGQQICESFAKSE